MIRTDALPGATSSVERRFRRVFGTIAIMATLVSTRSHLRDPEDLLEILITVAATLIVVHAFSDYLARRFDLDERPSLRQLLELVREELPLLAGAVVPCGMYGLSSLGVVSEPVAYGAAVGYAVLFLFVAGYQAARPGSLGRLIFSGAVFSAIGAVVIAIEASLH